MASKRKFYRSVIEVEVLSEEPRTFGDLYDVARQITYGDCSGCPRDVVGNAEVDGPTMARLLAAQGSDPEFFGLTDDGEDVDCDD